MGQSLTTHMMRLTLISLSLLLSYTLAQDTYHCPDGWTLEEDSSGCRCFLISGREQVTKQDADILCDFHDGAWVAELDHPGINYWLKSVLLKELRLENGDSSGSELPLRRDTVRTALVTGCGLTRMCPSPGLTGPTASPTTSAARTA